MVPPAVVAGSFTVSVVKSGPAGRVLGATGSGRGFAMGGGGGGGGGFGAQLTEPTRPVQKDVFLLAPAQVNEMCTWSVCLLAPV